MSEELPVEGLPPGVVERLGRWGTVRDVRPLVGGRGGRTSAVELDLITVVVHLRHGGLAALHREADATARAHRVGVGPELVDVVEADQAIVTRWIPGQALTAGDLADPALVARVARAVRRLHAAEPVPDQYVMDVLGSRDRYLARAARHGIDWPADVLAEQRRVDAIAARLAAAPVASPVPCHGDLVPSNLLLADEAVAVLDYEYAGLGDPAADLGGLAATAELDEAALAALVAAYGALPPERVRDWRDVVRHAWFVWVALGEDLGPERDRWVAWSSRARASWS